MAVDLQIRITVDAQGKPQLDGIRKVLREIATAAKNAGAQLDSGLRQGNASASNLAQAVNRVKEAGRGPLVNGLPETSQGFQRASTSAGQLITAVARVKQTGGGSLIPALPRVGPEFDRAASSARRAGSEMERSLRGANLQTNQLANSLRSIRNLIGAAFGINLGIGAVRDIARLSDSFNSANARLRQLTDSTEEYNQIQSDVFSIAQRQRARFEDLVDLYQRTSISAESLGASQQQLSQFTEGTAAALRLSGTTGAAASGALLQLSQALGTTNVRAQEFNSIASAAPVILIAAAEGMGITSNHVAELRSRMLDGNFAAQELFQGFITGSADLVEAAEKLPDTVSGSFTVLRNAFGDFIAKSEEAGGAVKAITTLFNVMAENIDVVVIALGALAAALALVVARSGLGALISVFNSIRSALPSVLRLKTEFNFLRAAFAGIAATGAAGVFAGIGRALLFLSGGPIGAVIGGIGLAALAFKSFSSESKSAVDNVTESVDDLINKTKELEGAEGTAESDLLNNLTQLEEERARIKAGIKEDEARLASLRKQRDEASVFGGGGRANKATLNRQIADFQDSNNIEEQRKALERLDEVIADQQGKLIKKERTFADEVAAIRDEQLEKLKENGDKQAEVLKELNRELAKARQEAKDIEKEFTDAITNLQGPSIRDEDLRLTDAARLGRQADQALDNGDFEEAIRLSREATEVIAKLKEQGDISTGALVGQQKQISETAIEAARANEQQLEAQVSLAQEKLNQIATQANALQQITFKFNEEESKQNAQTVFDALKAQALQNPVVIPVQLSKPANVVDQAIDDATGGGDVPGFATGGMLTGRGTDTSDNLLLWGSPGEFMVKARAVRKYGRALFERLNRMNLPRAQIPKFATGGLIGGSASTVLNSTASDPVTAGTPINLHIGDKVFKTSADIDEAEGIRRYVSHLSRKFGGKAL